MPSTVKEKEHCSMSTDLFCDYCEFPHPLWLDWREGEEEKKSGQQSLKEKESENIGFYIISITRNKKLKEEVLIGTDGNNDAQCDQINW